MAGKTEERIKALEVALNNESRERDFYLKHAERTSNPFGKIMFHSIAKDEDEHYQRLLELHQKLREEGRWPETIPLKVKGTDMKSILKKVVDSVDTSAQADTDDMEAVKIAIDLRLTGKNSIVTCVTASKTLQRRNSTVFLPRWRGSTAFPWRIPWTISMTPKAGAA